MRAAEELVRLDADVVALQEVRSHLAGNHNHLSDITTFQQGQAGYGFMAFRPYPGNAGEGLAFLSERPLRVARTGSAPIEDCALRVTVDIDRISQALRNVHLDWRRALTGDRQIVEIVSALTHDSGGDWYEILLGGFNSYPESSVHQILRGQQTLNGHDTVPWHDLAPTWVELAGFVPASTLDFGRNPR